MGGMTALLPRTGGKRMKRVLWLLLLLCLMAAGGAAQSVPLTDYAPGQMIDVGFHDPAVFLSGCTLESGKGFILVDSQFYGGYLLRSTGRIVRDTISAGIPLPEGDSAEVTAQDENSCEVRIWNERESRAYAFAFEPLQVSPDRWVLKSYTCREDGRVFSAQFGHDRIQAAETTAAGTEEYTAYYEFYAEANNLDHERIPASIKDVKRLEKAYPVAAVSPDDPGTRVNLRKAPSAKSERVGSLYSGTRLHIREITDDGWAKISVGDMDAYISTDYLTFGAALEQVPDARPAAKLPDEEWVEVSRKPYRGGGGTVTQVRGGQQVSVIGEYNGEWRMVQEQEWQNTFFIRASQLR